MNLFLIFVALIIAIFLFAPRPRLSAEASYTNTPQQTPAELEKWLELSETQTPNLLESAKARIQWANPNEKNKTPLSFLYLHGFSASWKETAPVTEKLAQEYSANVVQARISGHGTGPAGMLTSAEDWLQSVSDQFDIAQQIGERVVIIATSTGAPLTVWLAAQEGKKQSNQQKIAACIFLSPNFRIRNAFGFLLTWPWASAWIHIILGREISWEPGSELEGEVWTHQYSTLSLIEMQKVVDWANKQNFGSFKIPLAMMYMKNDGTIHPPSAIKVFNKWGAEEKELIEVSVDGDATDHVFVGEITAPHRIEWSVGQLIQFLHKVIKTS